MLISLAAGADRHHDKMLKRCILRALQWM